MARYRDRYDPSVFLFEAYNDFSGGLNTAYSPEQLAINDLTVAQNIDLSQRGAIWTQKGFVRLYPTSLGTGYGQGLIHYVHNGIEEIIVAFNGKLWKYNNSLGSWSELVITNLTSFQTTKPISWTVYRNKLYIATGTKLVEYDGSTCQVVPAYTPTQAEIDTIGTNLYSDVNLSLHTARFCMVHYDRLVLGWDDSNSKTLYFSDLERFGYFPAPNQYVIDNPRGEPITSILKYRDNIIVFTKTSIHGLFGTGTEINPVFTKRMLHYGYGSVSPLSAKVLGNSIAFVSYDGIKEIYSFSQVEQFFNVRPLQKYDKIKPNITSKTSQSLEQSVATVYDDQYIVNFPTDNEVYRYYKDLDAYSMDTAPQVAQYLTIDGTLYSLGFNNGLVYQHNVGWNYDGQPILAIAETKLLDLTEAHYRKRLSKIHVLLGKIEGVSQSEIYLTVKADGNPVLAPYTGETYIDTDGYLKWRLVKETNMLTERNALVNDWILGQSTIGIVELSQQKASVRGQARRVQVRFEADQLNVPMIINSFGLEFQMRRL